MEGRDGRGIERRMAAWIGLSRLVDQLANVVGHLVDGSSVELLQLLEGANVLISDEVDGDSLTAESTRPTDAMQVVLPVRGQVVVDHQRHLKVVIILAKLCFSVLNCNL